MTLRTAGSLGCDRSGMAMNNSSQSARNPQKNTASLKLKNTKLIEYSDKIVPGALNHSNQRILKQFYDAGNQTLQHPHGGKREQCDFADTDEFYNSLLEKATKKNVHSLNFMDLNA